MLIKYTLFEVDGPYATFHAGYAFTHAGEKFVTSSSFNSNSYTLEQKNVSLGKGFNVGGAFGYMFTNHLGAELGVSYLIGSKWDLNYTGTNQSDNYTFSSSMVRLNPSLILAVGEGQISPYAKFGVLLGFGSFKTEEVHRESGDETIMISKANGGMALGITSALGIRFNKSDKLSFFGELNLINSSYTPKSSTVTEYTENGVDQLSTLTTSEKETEYEKSVNYGPGSGNDPNKPSKEVQYKLPFGSLGFQIGVKFIL